MPPSQSEALAWWKTGKLPPDASGCDWEQKAPFTPTPRYATPVASPTFGRSNWTKMNVESVTLLATNGTTWPPLKGLSGKAAASAARSLFERVEVAVSLMIGGGDGAGALDWGAPPQAAIAAANMRLQARWLMRVPPALPDKDHLGPQPHFDVAEAGTGAIGAEDQIREAVRIHGEGARGIDDPV